MIRFTSAAAFALLSAGCTSVLPSTEGAGPDWFEARRAEVDAAGYPSLQAAASSLQVDRNVAPWAKIERDLTDAQLDLSRSDPGPVTVTAEQMRAWAEQQRLVVAKGEEPY